MNHELYNVHCGAVNCRRCDMVAFNQALARARWHQELWLWAVFATWGGALLAYWWLR